MRLSKGLGAQGYAQAVQIFIRLAEVPLLLAFWGPRLYGEWLMLSSIPSYLVLFDGGFSATACREMSIRCGAGDRKGALSVFQSTWLLLFIISLGIVLIAFFSIRIAPLHEWLGLKVMSPTAVKLASFLLVIHILVVFHSDLVYGGFCCEGYYAEGITLAATTQLMEFGFLAAAVFMGGGPAGAALGFAGGRIAGFALMRLGLYRVNPWLRYGWGAASIGELKRMAPAAFGTIFYSVGNAFNFQGVRLAVGLALGPTAVTVFSTIRTLTRFSIQPGGIINRLIEPEMASAHGGGHREVFRRLYTRSCQVAIWFSVVVSIALGVSGKWVLDFWTKGMVPMDWPLYLMLLISAVINAAWYTAWMAAYATNRHVKLAIVHFLVYGISAILLTYVIAHKAGMAGVGLVLLLVELIMAPYVIVKTLNLVGETSAYFLGQIARPPLFLFDKIRKFA